MKSIFADRISDVPQSFIREILKVTVDEEVISFAGGLPNRDFFPVREIQDACVKVLSADGKNVLQYSTTEGYLPLREYIAEQYRIKQDMEIDPGDILITSGSQQGLDLVGKTLLNEGDHLAIEEPGYLGAIQAFSIYKSVFHGVPLLEDGPDLAVLEKALKENSAKNPIKIFYGVPNFQNPSGVSYSREKREQVGKILKEYGTIFIEDNPYGELRFMGEDKPLVKEYLPEQTILLGSFSKTVVPSFRMGWITANKEIMERLVIAKQASDLHTNYFTQRVLYQYLSDNDIDEHIAKIRSVYRKQRDAMVQSIEQYFPEEVSTTSPEGGMFLWATLPQGMSSMELFEIARKENVVFVPGNPFYPDGKDRNTLRLNFSCVDEETIEEGIKRLGRVIKSMVI
ncbi:MAG: PLP-dependent aminotransferase family protein [bacterium]|nr:PLP-dependent aminotransferase family protein [bacterium]